MANTTGTQKTTATKAKKATTKKATTKKKVNYTPAEVDVQREPTTWLLITSNRKAGTISGLIAHTDDIDSAIRYSRVHGEHFVCVGTDTKFRAYIDSGLEKGMRGVIAALTKKGITDVASFLKEAFDKVGDNRTVLIQKPVADVIDQ